MIISSYLREHLFYDNGLCQNLFFRESKQNWDQEVRDDVIEECSKHGGVLHLYVDKASPQGNVYVKCPTISAAVASVNSLHGRFFGGVYFCYLGNNDNFSVDLGRLFTDI